jgi:RNA polymerase sigma-70 factor (ECF subfamily)
MRETQMPDDITVALAREGDRDALRRLYEGHREQVYRTAYRYCRSVQDAEDVMQETFLRAFSRIRTFDSHASAGFSSWIVSICINSAIDHLRRRERRNDRKCASLSSLGQDVPSHNPSPEDAEVRRQALEKIRNNLRVLSPRQRVVFDMRYDQHMDIKDIAGCLDCSESNVKTQIFRSLKRLRKTLEPVWRKS